MYINMYVHVDTGWSLHHPPGGTQSGQDVWGGITRFINATTITCITSFNFISYVQARGERIVFSVPNTNTNIIRVRKFDGIRIQILFVLFIMTEYEYEYYSGS